MIQTMADVMKVCLDGGKPMPMNFSAEGRTVALADWSITCDYDGVAPLGQQVEAEIRLAPGVVFYGPAMIVSTEPTGGYGWGGTGMVARVAGCGGLRPGMEVNRG